MRPKGLFALESIAAPPLHVAGTESEARGIAKFRSPRTMPYTVRRLTEAEAEGINDVIDASAELTRLGYTRRRNRSS